MMTDKTMKKLGFGMMRMPLTDPNNEGSVDIEHVKKMVDLFMENGFTYFDTAIMYNGCVSQRVLKETVVDRYPRECLQVATKMHSDYFKTMEDVVSIAEQVQLFCLERGIDRRRSYLAGLAMEEMAGNVVEHGFSKDKAKHTVDVRVSIKDDDLILRIKDDCIKFDPVKSLTLKTRPAISVSA